MNRRVRRPGFGPGTIAMLAAKAKAMADVVTHDAVADMASRGGCCAKSQIGVQNVFQSRLG